MNKHILLALAGTLVLYLLGSFYYISFDISQWEPVGRAVWVTLVAILAYFTMAFQA